MDCRVCTYVLIAIIKKRLHLLHSLYEIPQILSLTMFETTPITQLLTGSPWLAGGHHPASPQIRPVTMTP